MKIIFSPSKEMSFNTPISEAVKYSDKTKYIINELKKLSSAQIKTMYNISDKVLSDLIKYIESFDIKESYKAIEMYNGLSFRSLDLMSLNNNCREYLDNHLIILSAFYGPIPPEKLIRPYRLDFNTGLKVNGSSLTSFWKDTYNSSFNKGEVVINLASLEFSNLLNRDNFIFYDFEFLENKNGKLKSHSTISKKARGLMLKYLCKNKISDLDEIKNFDSDGFCYDKKLSDNNKFVFIK